MSQGQVSVNVYFQKKNIVVELGIGKGETSNDPQEKYRIDEVGQAPSFTLVSIFLAIPTERRR